MTNPDEYRQAAARLRAMARAATPGPWTLNDCGGDGGCLVRHRARIVAGVTYNDDAQLIATLANPDTARLIAEVLDFLHLDGAFGSLPDDPGMRLARRINATAETGGAS